MKIVRTPAPSGFTQVPNSALRDERLSYKARGIHANLLSNSDEDWNETAESLAAKSPEGRDSVRSGLRELARYGYIEYSKSQGQDGRWQTAMIVYTAPGTENPSSVPPAETPLNPQVAPETGNPSSDRRRETRPRSDQEEQGVSAGGTEDWKTDPRFPRPYPEDHEEEPSGDSQPARPRAAREAIPDWALPLVHRIHAAGLPGLRWNLAGTDWFLVHSLMKAKGVEAMADYAARVSASSSKPVFSARYFLPGWKELTDAPPAGNGTPTLRAVSGGTERQTVGRRQLETNDLFDRAMQRAIAREEQQ